MENLKGVMEGKICMITGATSGIGLSTANGLSRLGASLILIGRSEEKCQRICQKLSDETRNPNIEYMVADLSSQKDIHNIAEQFKQRYDKLDVLVNNAGAKFVNRFNTVDGYEMTLALNHLAYFFLTRLLMKSLKSSPEARIINVSSGAHLGAEIDFNDIENKNNYIGKKAYGQSKLANILFTYELDRLIKDSAVTVNAMAPGGVITNFCKNNGWISWIKHVGAHVISRDLIGPDKASETIIYMASSSDLKGLSGRYFFSKIETNSSKASYDVDSAKKLWDISIKMTSM